MTARTTVSVRFPEMVDTVVLYPKGLHQHFIELGATHPHYEHAEPPV
jgi:hypothetical protein